LKKADLIGIQNGLSIYKKGLYKFVVKIDSNIAIIITIIKYD